MASIDYQSCAIAIARAEVRFNQRGCAGLISYAAEGSNSISGAPTDGSCSIFHSSSGGVNPCSVGSYADLTKLDTSKNLAV